MTPFPSPALTRVPSILVVRAQLNIFYYLYVLKPVYVHDETKCSDPFFWEPQRAVLHNFNMRFIDEVFELMLTKR